MKKLFGILVCLSAMSIMSYDAVAGKSSSSSSSSSRSSSSSSSRSSSYSSPSKSSSGIGKSSGSSIWGGSSSTPKPKASTPAPSTSKPSSTKPKDSGIWGNTKKTPPPPVNTTKNKEDNKWGSNAKSKPTVASTPAPAPKVSEAEKARQTANIESKKNYDSTNGSNKIFPTRQAAVEKWKIEEAPKYTNKFSTPPIERPSYIPSTVTVTDSTTSLPVTRPIYYSQSSGGYGYMDVLGHFILWDALTDIEFQNQNMTTNNYYINEEPNTQMANAASAAASAAASSAANTIVRNGDNNDENNTGFNIFVSIIVVSILGITCFIIFYER